MERGVPTSSRSGHPSGQIPSGNPRPASFVVERGLVGASRRTGARRLRWATLYDPPPVAQPTATRVRANTLRAVLQNLSVTSPSFRTSRSLRRLAFNRSRAHVMSAPLFSSPTYTGAHRAHLSCMPSHRCQAGTPFRMLPFGRASCRQAILPPAWGAHRLSRRYVPARAVRSTAWVG